MQLQLQGSDASHTPNAIIPTQLPSSYYYFLSQTTIFPNIQLFFSK